jgi:GTP-binding protein YchF
MLRVGIVGLPNAGKSTLFNALTRGHQAPVASYPFCTIEPNVGVIEVPDDRLDRLIPIYGSAKKISAAVEFFDIAGLVRGASQGEGLGNRFLANIREVDAIVEVVRCFEEQDVAHVDGDLDGLRDIETIRTELALADLETVDRRRQKVAKLARAGDKTAQTDVEILDRLDSALNDSQTVRGFETSTIAERELLGELFLLTGKPIVYVANVSESEFGSGGACVSQLRERANAAESEVVEVCAELESQLADLDKGEANEYLEAVGITSLGTEELIRAAYRTLGLITFFTGNEKEVRARAIPRGTHALDAAGHVHSDIARGFIGAEIIPFELLIKEQSIHHAREDGRLRLEGKEYEVQDGDVVFFRFNV